MPERRDGRIAAVVRAIPAALGAAAGTFVVSAIGFAVLDLYLSGHGGASPSQQTFAARGFVQLSVADAVALGLSALVGMIVMISLARRR
jgi:hypothetical protein